MNHVFKTKRTHLSDLDKIHFCDDKNSKKSDSNYYKYIALRSTICNFEILSRFLHLLYYDENLRLIAQCFSCLTIDTNVLKEVSWISFHKVNFGKTLFSSGNRRYNEFLMRVSMSLPFIHKVRYDFDGFGDE